MHILKTGTILLAFIVVAACHSEKKAAESKPSPAPAAKTVSDDDATALNNLIVSFYSKGSGIDREAAGNLEHYISEYIRKTGTKVAWKKTAWGKEGETDYCISLSVMNNEQRSKFITAVKDVLRSVETVHIYENRPCRDMK